MAMTVNPKVSQVHPYVLSEIYARHCGKTKVEYDTVPSAQAGGRGHITRDLQAKARSLNFILRKTGSCGSKTPQVLIELREWRPVRTGYIASLAAKSTVFLLVP